MSKRVATTLEIPSGSRLVAMASVRGSVGTGAAGDETDHPPSRVSMAVAPAAIVVRSSCIPLPCSAVVVGTVCVKAAIKSAAGWPECSTRPDTVQPASLASGRTVPAASNSVICHASHRAKLRGIQGQRNESAFDDNALHSGHGPAVAVQQRYVAVFAATQPVPTRPATQDAPIDTCKEHLQRTVTQMREHQHGWCQPNRCAAECQCGQ